MKLAEVAQKIGCRLEGPPELEIVGWRNDSAERGNLHFSQIGGTFGYEDTRGSDSYGFEVCEGVALRARGSLPRIGGTCVRRAHYAASAGPRAFRSAAAVCARDSFDAIIEKGANWRERAYGPVLIR